MAVRRLVELLACRDRQGKPIFFRRQGTSGIGRYRTWRTVGAVEIENHRPLYNRSGVEKAATRIGVGLRRRIRENEEQTYLRVAPKRCKSQFLAVQLEGNYSRHDLRRRITQGVGNFDGLLTARRSPGRRSPVAQVERIEHHSF